MERCLQSRQRSTAALKGQDATSTRRKVKKQAFYSDEEDESTEEIEIIEVLPGVSKASRQSQAVTTSFADEDSLDPDHQLLLKSSLPLLRSRNSAVVLAVASLHYYAGLPDSATGALLAKALVRVQRSRREVAYMVLHTIQLISKDRPQLFRPYLSEFFITSSDPIFNR